MDSRNLLDNNGGGEGVFPNFGIGLIWLPRDDHISQASGLFASVGQMGMANSNDNGIQSLYSSQFVSSAESGFRVVGVSKGMGVGEEWEVSEGSVLKKRGKKKGGVKLKIKIGNTSLRRLISGAIAGAVSTTAVAPLETIRTHLMVGSCGHSSTEVFQDIMKTEGWKGLFRGNLVNVIRVAPAKAIELFAYEIVKHLTPKTGEEPKFQIPPIFSCRCYGWNQLYYFISTYPLESALLFYFHLPS